MAPQCRAEIGVVGSIGSAPIYFSESGEKWWKMIKFVYLRAHFRVVISLLFNGNVVVCNALVIASRLASCAARAHLS